MVYNKKVDHVIFQRSKNVKEENIVGSIQRKIERWASSACPTRARMLVAPHEIKEISESRRKRSIKRSVPRNNRHFIQNNWEIEWLMTLTKSWLWLELWKLFSSI